MGAHGQTRSSAFVVSRVSVVLRLIVRHCFQDPRGDDGDNLLNALLGLRLTNDVWQGIFCHQRGRVRQS
jgi:hypothetical protein